MSYENSDHKLYIGVGSSGPWNEATNDRLGTGLFVHTNLLVHLLRTFLHSLRTVSECTPYFPLHFPCTFLTNFFSFPRVAVRHNQEWCCFQNHRRSGPRVFRIDNSNKTPEMHNSKYWIIRRNWLVKIDSNYAGSTASFGDGRNKTLFQNPQLDHS